MELVWEEVIRLYGMMLDQEGWKGKEIVDVSCMDVRTTTVFRTLLLSTSTHVVHQLALGVISATGFDEPLKEWRRSPKLQIGQDVTLPDAVAAVSGSLIPWALLPPWVFKLPMPFKE
jgi:hypothetical protein